jgi:hypothetical protein
MAQATIFSCVFKREKALSNQAGGRREGFGEEGKKL